VYRARILVVDDEAAVQEVVGDLLTAGGYEVKTVGTYEAALTAVTEHRFDVIISDLCLAGARGDRLVEEIVRRRPGLANRIILLTGDGTEARPALPVLLKPFHLDAVLSAVEDRLSA
jgi:DNA-binding NtrC family response regulator